MLLLHASPLQSLAIIPVLALPALVVFLQPAVNHRLGVAIAMAPDSTTMRERAVWAACLLVQITPTHERTYDVHVQI